MPAPDSPGASGATPPRRDPYAYALIRVVPRVERGECLNAGVVLFCRPRRFLQARIALDPARVEALAPGTDLEPIQRLLDRIPLVCAGGEAAGPIGLLPQSERFHWLVAPSSTVIQPGPVHTGLCDDPERTLDHLFADLVLPLPPP